MGKYPKFFVAKNPMAEPEGVYIFHSQKPRFLAKVEGGAVEVVDDIDAMPDFYCGNAEKVAGLIKRTLTGIKRMKSIAKKENRGGKRPGAGRKPSGIKKESVRVQLSLEPKTVDAIRESFSTTVARGEFMRSCVERGVDELEQQK